MAGMKFTTDLDADAASTRSRFAGRCDMGFTVRDESDSSFTAKMGNMPLSVIAGAVYALLRFPRVDRRIRRWQ